MDLAEFDALTEPLRRKSAEVQSTYGFNLIEGRIASADEIANFELDLAVVLPDKYKAFMMRFGGGMFGYVELLPIVAMPGTYDDLSTINDSEFPDRSFLAVAPVGTGDYWGFPVIAGRCLDAVWYRYHDIDEDELVAADFLDFIAEHGLKSSADRALERRE
jgi:hypothetical protein